MTHKNPHGCDYDHCLGCIDSEDQIPASQQVPGKDLSQADCRWIPFASNPLRGIMEYWVTSDLLVSIEFREDDAHPHVLVMSSGLSENGGLVRCYHGNLANVHWQNVVNTIEALKAEGVDVTQEL